MPTANRVSAAAAVAAALLWAAKAIAIWIAGGLDESPLESPLFVLGLLAIVTAYIALGVAAARSRSTLVATLAGVGGLVVGVAVALVADALAGAVLPDSAGWVQEEAGLWLAAGLTVIVAVGWLFLREPGRGTRGA
jgi:hypothetical protein